MNEIIEKENIIIEDMIYEVRGVQVMLDSNIAKLYRIETKRINLEVSSQTFLSISKNQVYNKLIHPSSQQKTKKR